MQKLLLMYLLLCTFVVVQAQQPSTSKTQATTMVAINQPKEVDTTTSPNVRAMIQILRNKHKYIGQPFSVLLKDLPDTIKYFYPLFVSSDISEQKYYAIRFNDPNEGLKPNRNFFKTAAVNITWQTPIKFMAIRQFLVEDNNWNKETEAFFAPLIVEDVEMVRPIEVSKAGGWLHWP